ncbi:hypothetical protein QE152_g40644 [Popillia japonica]|uniref:Integrase zinc-binding domain-containing protein n=1 Tax=Popillia japonica TaxID=7064 RepID=A0AAW1HFH9_POPJA
MTRKVKEYVTSCDVCQKVKPPNQASKCYMKNVLASRPLEKVSVDLYGPLPQGRGGKNFRTYWGTWPNFVGSIENWLNCTEHDSTGFSPYELMKGERPRRLIEQLIKYPNRTDRLKEEKIILAQERLQKIANLRRYKKPITDPTGDDVKILDGKRG